MNNTLQRAYDSGFNEKLAGIGQHIMKVYDQYKDKLTGDSDPSVVQQTALGGVAGAGLGGLAALHGNTITQSTAKRLSGVLGKTVSPDAAHQWLAMEAMKPGSPFTTKAYSLMSSLGKMPAATTLIPAGILALIAGIRARNRQR